MAFVMTRQSALKSLKKKHGPPTQAEIAALGKLGETHRAEGDGSPDSAPADEAQGKNAPASSAPTNGVSASNGSTGHGPTGVPTSSGGGEASNTPQPT
jgi:hypothetical protein